MDVRLEVYSLKAFDFSRGNCEQCPNRFRCYTSNTVYLMPEKVYTLDGKIPFVQAIDVRLPYCVTNPTLLARMEITETGILFLSTRIRVDNTLLIPDSWHFVEPRVLRVSTNKNVNLITLEAVYKRSDGHDKTFQLSPHDYQR